MKKLLAASVLSLMSLGAQAYDCSILLINENNNRILESFHGYGFGGDMCRDELRACKRASKVSFGHLNTRCEKLDTYYPGTGTYTPGGVIVVPNPGPVVVNPGPVIVTPQPTPGIMFRTTIALEDQIIQVNSVQPGDVYLSCLQLAQRMGTSIDQVMVTVGNGQTQYSYNSTGYWTDQSACMVAQNMVNQSMNTTSFSRNIQVVGSIESYSFVSNGPTKADVLADCMSSLKGISGQVDDMTLSVNGRNMVRLYNSTNFWNDASACREMMKLVDQTI
jgi:hypothetical protein